MGIMTVNKKAEMSLGWDGNQIYCERLPSMLSCEEWSVVREGSLL